MDKCTARGGDLEARLDAYEAQARATTAAAQDTTARWPTYAAAVGSGLALATAVGADIMYSGPQNVKARIAKTTGNPSFQSSALAKLNICGKDRLSIGVFATHVFVGQSDTTYRGHGAFARGIGKVSVLKISASSGLKRLASGAKISNNAPGVWGKSGALTHQFTTASNGSIFSSGRSGSWPKAKKGFAGLRFTSNGQTEFGWVRLVWEAGSREAGDPFGFPISITAIDWACDTSGDPILAGQVSSPPPATVPEPGTLSLMLLAMGSAGVLAWRRRLKASV